MLAFLFKLRFRIARDPLGTGTRIALEVNLPSNDGNALATALPAPVSVIIPYLMQQPFLVGIYYAYYQPNFDRLYKHEWFLNDHLQPQNYLQLPLI